MPGEDERPPGDAAPESARLDAVAARLETLGAALQRSIGETTESTAILSRTVGNVSSDLGRLIGEAVTALGQTRKIVLATDDAVGSVAEAFGTIEARLAEVATELAGSIERQAHIEEHRPDPGALAAAVGAEVGRALTSFTDRFAVDLDAVLSELREDRAVFSRRLAGQREVEALRELVENLAGRSDIEEVVAELQGGLETVIDAAIAAHRPDDAPIERLRSDLLALGDDMATTAKRAGAGQRAVEELRRHIEKDLLAQLERAVTATGGEVKHDTEVLMAELHDDLSLVMRQVVAGNHELEALRQAVAELAAHAEESPEAAATGDDLLRAVGDLHEDLSLVLKRLAAGQRELDDVREAILAGPPARAASVDAGALAGAVRDELTGPLAEIGDDLSVLVRSVSGTQEELDGLRAAVTDLAEAVAAAEAPDGAELEEDPDLVELVEGLRIDIDAGLGSAVSDLRDELDSVRRLLVDQAPPLEAAEIRAEVDGLLADVRDDLALLAQQLATGQDDVAGLRAEVLDSLASREPADAVDDEVRAELAALGDEVRGQFERLRNVLGRRPEDSSAVVADLQDDLGVVLGQVVAAQQDLQALRDETGAGQEDVHALLEAILSGQDDIRALRDEVAALLEVNPAGAGPDLEQLEVAIADLPTIMSNELRAEVEVLTDELRAGISELRALARSTAGTGDGGIAAELQGLVDDLQTDLGTMLREIVAGQGEVGLLRAEVATVAEQVSDALAGVVNEAVADAVTAAMPVEDPALAIEGMRADVTAGLADMAADLRADLEGLVAELHEDLGRLMNQVVAGQDDLDTLRSELAAQGGPEHVADDLDRLSRDLQALRDRIPGAADSATAARRRPRARPQR